MSKQTVKKHLLVSLTGAALALPGIALAKTSKSNQPAKKPSVSTKKKMPDVTNPGEVNNILESPLLIAERPRKPVKHLFMDLMYGNHTTTFLATDTTQFGANMTAPMGTTSSVNDGYSAYFEIPVNDHQDIDVTLIRDVVTSATPIMYVPPPSFLTPATSTRQFTTRATVKDRRSAVDLKTTYYADNYSIVLNGGLSTEDDYDSLFFGIKGNIDFNNNNSTITLGTSFARNHSDPISEDAVLRTTGPYDHGISNNEEYLLGYTQIFSPRFLAQQNIYYGQEHCYLSNPYKAVYFAFQPLPFNFQLLQDTRPESRHIWAFVTHLA